MNRYLTAFSVETETTYVFTEEDLKDIEHPCNWADDWVWQFAPDKDTARIQHDNKMDEWEMNPEKDTY